MNIVDIKHNNRSNVYFYLRDHGQATKQEIAYNLQLSLPTVTRNLIDLTNWGLIDCEAKVISKTGGRNPIAYTYLSAAKVAIGIDISRHHVKSIIVDLDGSIIKYVYRRRDYSRTDEYLQMLGKEIDFIINDSQLDREKILGVGIAVPGVVDQENEYVVDGRVIDNTGMTCADFSKYIPYNTKLIHDTKAAGFSEIIKSPNVHNACYINLSSSIGGAVFINDKIFRGDGLYSCELGHLNLIPGGLTCYCGQKGCIDSYCNAEVLSQHTGGDLFTFFEKLESGHQKLVKIWQTYLDHLATAITETRLMFGCKIIIGGDVGIFIDKYMEVLRTKVDDKSSFGEKSVHFLFPCRNKREAVATGAALYFVQEFLDKCLGSYLDE